MASLPRQLDYPWTAMTRESNVPRAEHMFTRMDSPVGRLTLAATAAGLAAILWENDGPRRVPVRLTVEDATQPILALAVRQLDEYFAGQRRRFSVPLDVAGTAFQRSVWEGLQSIPFGETRSYGQLAAQIGRPTAVRAVGAANGRNPISIMTPCHRVLGATGKLTGFAGGLEVKARLLALEAPNG